LGVWLAEAGKRGKRIAGVKKRSIYTRPALEKTKYLSVKEHGRWVKIASAFPFSPTTHNKRGVNSTDWIRIDRATYDACLDPHDYRPKKLSD